MKVALYARVSTRDKQQNPEVQLSALRKYSDAMEWTIYKEFVDKASAADLDNRTAWKELIAAANHHEFDTVLIWKLDRAFRSVSHASTTINDLKSWKISFRSYMDPSIDTTTPNGELVFHILAAVAQFEKDLITMRINEGMAYAKSHGTKSGNPIGRKGYDMPLQTICKAVSDSNGNQSEAAKILSKILGRKVSAGFISLRIKRAGLTKQEIMAESATTPLQRVGHKKIKKQDESTGVK